MRCEILSVLLCIVLNFKDKNECIEMMDLIIKTRPQSHLGKKLNPLEFEFGFHHIFIGSI